MMARVGVCTRPTDATLPPREPNMRLVRARVPLMPMSQSLSERQRAASASGTIWAPSRRCWKASRIPVVVMDDIHRRLTGSLHLASWQM